MFCLIYRYDILKNLKVRKWGQSRCNSDETTFERIKRKYADTNYKIPEIFFWNVNAKTKNCPVRFNEKGVALISGFSPNILKYILGKDNITPEKIMMDVLKKYME